MPATHESDLRSLNRRRMYSIFPPLDPKERLPHELLEERPAPRGVSVPPRYGQLGRKELTAVLWLPTVLLLLAAAGLGWLDAPATFAAGGVVAMGLIGFALTGPRKRR